MLKAIGSHHKTTRLQGLVTRWRRGLIIASTVVCAIGCAQKLDSEQIASNIQAELEQAADLSVESVTCPEAIALEPESTFRCTGELASGSTFVIDVTQTDQPGQVSWKVPSSKGLLNLGDLEQHFQKELASETVAVPVVNCGSNYRPNQIGDRFDCRVINGILSDQTKIEKITVTVDAQQNVTWQQVRQQLVATQSAPVVQPATGVAPTAIASPQIASPRPKLGTDIGD